ncbi:MAG: preprotein translocase subunit SecE [Deltaproteobacteria bacterium]|nr:preprotein translocase subunit SecE [Deltaproteobacteria bacterium]
MIEKMKDFLREAKVEVKKVTWPDRKTTTASTIVVLVVVVVVASYLGVVDLIVNEIARVVLS